MLSPCYPTSVGADAISRAGIDLFIFILYWYLKYQKTATSHILKKVLVGTTAENQIWYKINLTQGALTGVILSKYCIQIQEQYITFNSPQ